MVFHNLNQILTVLEGLKSKSIFCADMPFYCSINIFEIKVQEKDRSENKRLYFLPALKPIHQRLRSNYHNRFYCLSRSNQMLGMFFENLNKTYYK